MSHKIIKQVVQEWAVKNIPHQIICENQAVTKTQDLWLRFDYIPVDTWRPCTKYDHVAYKGMWQIQILFSPGSGTDKARGVAEEIEKAFYPGWHQKGIWQHEPCKQAEMKDLPGNAWRYITVYGIVTML